MLKHIALIAALTCASIATATAKSPQAPAQFTSASPEKDWTLTVAPYFWMAGMSGNIVSDRAPPVHLDAKFSKILDALDFSTMLVSELRYDRFVLLNDLMYLKVSTDVNRPHGLPVTVDAGAQMLQWTPMAGYSLVDTDRAHLEIMAGARLWSVEMNLTTHGGVFDGLSAKHTETWIDAMAGVKGQFSLTDRFYVAGWAMYGGGGSEHTWDLMAGVGYRINDRLQAMLGYRAQSVEYRKGPFVFDTKISGPIMGASLKF